MNVWIFTFLIMYIGSRMTPGQRLTVKALYFFVFLLPLSLALWKIGAFGLFCDLLLSMFSAVGALLWMLWKAGYGI